MLNFSVSIILYYYLLNYQRIYFEHGKNFTMIFVCLFVCLEFIVPLENFSLIWRCDFTMKVIVNI